MLSIVLTFSLSLTSFLNLNSNLRSGYGSFSVALALREANLVSCNIGPKYISPLPYCQPAFSFVLIPISSDV